MDTQRNNESRLRDDQVVQRLLRNPQTQKAAEDAIAYFTGGIEPADPRTKRTITWGHVEEAYKKLTSSLGEQVPEASKKLPSPIAEQVSDTLNSHHPHLGLCRHSTHGEIRRNLNDTSLPKPVCDRHKFCYGQSSLRSYRNHLTFHFLQWLRSARVWPLILWTWHHSHSNAARYFSGKSRSFQSHLAVVGKEHHTGGCTAWGTAA